MKRAAEPIWNDAANAESERLPATVDDRVDVRIKAKRLADCAMPPGFWLVTQQPRQKAFEGQMRWAFVVGWKDKKTGKEFFHLARYEEEVSDEMQLAWALDDFKGELEASGYTIEPARKGDLAKFTAACGMAQQNTSARVARRLLGI